MFEVGDLVKLKSGGPLMTVSQIGGLYDDTAIVCTYFAGTKKEEETFAAKLLVKAE